MNKKMIQSRAMKMISFLQRGAAVFFLSGVLFFPSAEAKTVDYRSVTSQKFLLLRSEIYSWPMSLEKNPQFFSLFTKYQYQGKKVAFSDASLLAENRDLPFEKSEVVGVNRAEIEKWLREKVAPEVEREPQSVVISELSDGKIDFQGTGLDGVAIDYPKTLAAIERAMEENVRSVVISTLSVPAPIQVLSPHLSELGIREVLATGTSDYSDSTDARIHNVTIGAKTLDGHLVLPGEEFSVVQWLGPVNGSQGYVKELIIRGNVAVPDFGGGLCQVSSTLFRSALLAGLPIIERSPHSYAVTYYEPYGTDATVFPGSHDLRFKNDMKTSVLIHSYFDGDHTLRFTLFGTKDGRDVRFSETEYSRFIPPPPDRVIVDHTIAPGRKKLVNQKHGGFDALFYRFVYKNKEEKVVDEFGSRYKPTQKIEAVGE